MEYMHPERLPHEPPEHDELSYQDYAAVRRITSMILRPFRAVRDKANNFLSEMSMGLGMEAPEPQEDASKMIGGTATRQEVSEVASQPVPPSEFDK